MRREPPTDPPTGKGLGLDMPCKSCGQEIYYNYQGPLEGICGRCTDRVVGRHARPGKSRVVVKRTSGESSRLVLLLVFFAGAVAGIVALRYLPF